MNHFARAVQLVGGPTKMAGVLGCSVQAVCLYRDGKRRLPFEHGAPIELATDRQVTRQQLFPHDWQRIWPELAEAEQTGEGGAQLSEGDAPAPGEDGAQPPPFSTADRATAAKASGAGCGDDALPSRRAA